MVFIPQAQPHAQSLFLFPIVFGINNSYGQGYVYDAIHWFLHKFKIDLVDTLRAFKAAARLVYPATALLLNPTAAGIRLS